MEKRYEVEQKESKQNDMKKMKMKMKMKNKNLVNYSNYTFAKPFLYSVDRTVINMS